MRQSPDRGGSASLTSLIITFPAIRAGPAHTTGESRIGTPVRQPDDLPNLVVAILSVTIGVGRIVSPGFDQDLSLGADGWQRISYTPTRLLEFLVIREGGLRRPPCRPGRLRCTGVTQAVYDGYRTRRLAPQACASDFNDELQAIIGPGMRTRSLSRRSRAALIMSFSTGP